MNKSYKKIKQLSPLITVRKTQYDRELAILGAIRAAKQNAMNEMNLHQSKYLAGITDLNSVRSSEERKNLETLEIGIDYLKNKWMEHYRKIQEIEQQEAMQTETVQQAAKQLKIVEKLVEKHQFELRAHITKKEQENLDENSLQKIVRNRS